MAKRGARRGFTTGSAAAAAAKAAALCLLSGRTPDSLDIPLPGQGRLNIPVREVRCISPDAAEATVVKDGGDDPDATHGARIRCRVARREGDGRIVVAGGPGVGRVTLPGLPVAVGEWAINPAPLAQIAASVREAAEAAGYSGGLEVSVSVEDGEKIAKKTLNARLGIVGGISILGTTGIVVPFSHAAWKASVASALDVAKASGTDQVGLATGRGSERLLEGALPGLPRASFVLAADYFAFATAQAGARGFARINWACFPGKLVKMALGFAYTHAGKGGIDFARLADWLAGAGGRPETVRLARESVTARGVFEAGRDDPALPGFATLLADKALKAARRHAGDGPDLALFVFDFDGRLMHVAEDGARESTPASAG